MSRADYMATPELNFATYTNEFMRESEIIDIAVGSKIAPNILKQMMCLEGMYVYCMCVCVCVCECSLCPRCVCVCCH